MMTETHAPQKLPKNVPHAEWDNDKRYNAQITFIKLSDVGQKIT